MAMTLSAARAKLRGLIALSNCATLIFVPSNEVYFNFGDEGRKIFVSTIKYHIFVA